MTLSPPERATERQQAKRIRAQIYRVGGCAVCKNAVHGWASPPATPPDASSRAA